MHATSVAAAEPEAEGLRSVADDESGDVDDVDEAEDVEEGARSGAEERVEEAMLSGTGRDRVDQMGEIDRRHRKERHRKEGRQSPQGRTLPPTFEKPHEERAYEREVSLGVRMCQLFCTHFAGSCARGRGSICYRCGGSGPT
jgi:hypothetical protein